MRVLPFIIFTVIITALISGCGPKVSSSIGKDSLNKYKTYSWIEIPNERTAYTRDSRRKIIVFDIEKDIDMELNKRGYQKVSSDPDFLLSPKAFLEKEDYGKNNEIIGTKITGTFGSSSTLTSGVKLVDDNLLWIKIDVIDPITKDTVWAVSRNRVIPADAMTLSGVIEKDIHSVIKKLPVCK